MVHFLTLGAVISAAISAFCLFLVGADLIHALSYENANHDSNPDIVKRYFEKLPILIRLALPFSAFFLGIARLRLFNRQRIKTANLLMQAGFGQAISAEKFIAARIGVGFLGFLFGFVLIVTNQLLSGILIITLLYIYPQVWLTRMRNTRHLEIQKALPNLLDLLTLSVEAGKDFLTSMRDILKRRKLDALGEELNRTFQDIQLGKSRRDALRELSARVQQADLTSVMNAIIQAEELGVSIGQILRIQGDQLRIKRFQRADKLANEAPTKILMPLVFCIFPAVFIILLSPILYNYVINRS